METAESSIAGIDRIDPLPPDAAADVLSDVQHQIQSAVVTNTDFIDLLLSGVVARGHIQLEDVPGTGKTLAAQVLAQALGVSYSRVQFTPDLLPADITGSHVYNEQEQRFEFQEGPVFANVVLADEINRAPPKTQAALLEAMGEGQVSVDGTTYDLPKPFFVIATQNPIEQSGTFELPEAQRDRFSIQTAMGYPEKDGEHELLERRSGRRTQVPTVESVADAETVRQLQVASEDVTVKYDVRDYIINIARATRDDERTEIGVSPRGVQKMFEAVRALAVINGREYVTPNDVKRLAGPVFAHRLVLTTDASVRDVERGEIIKEIVNSMDVPGMSEE